MKCLKTSIFSLAISTAMTLSAASYAADYEIESVEITQLFSATFDGLVFSKSLVDDGTFFGAVPDINNPVFGQNRAISISTTGDHDGGGTISFDGSQLNQLAVTLPDTVLTIITSATGTLVTETSGASFSINNVPNLDGGDDANFDSGGPLANGATDYALDFSEFNALGTPGVVNTCVNADNYCGLLPTLSLDGVRYTLEGTPTEAGGDVLTLRVQSSNGSYYEVELTTALAAEDNSKNVPAMGTFGLVALFGGLIAVAAKLRRRLA
jgi:hypothetical protein